MIVLLRTRGRFVDAWFGVGLTGLRSSPCLFLLERWPNTRHVCSLRRQGKARDYRCSILVLLLASSISTRPCGPVICWHFDANHTIFAHPMFLDVHSCYDGITPSKPESSERYPDFPQSCLRGAPVIDHGLLWTKRRYQEKLLPYGWQIKEGKLSNTAVS